MVIMVNLYVNLERIETLNLLSLLTNNKVYLSISLGF